MTAGISGGYQTVAFFRGGCAECFVDLLAGILGSQGIIFRRAAGNRLIPEGEDPCGSVRIAERRVGIIHAGINAGKKDAVAEESLRTFLKRLNTGNASSGKVGEKKPLGHLHVGDLRKFCDIIHQLFRQGQDCVLEKQISDADALLFQKGDIPLILYDDLPGLCGEVITGTQGRRGGALGGGGVQGQIQQIFTFLIVHDGIFLKFIKFL